ncbi:MAG: pseudouridine synthase [Acidimicrobiia bacterium]
MAEPIRIQKAIANAGLMSRRAAEEAIRAGRIRVDGRLARLGDRVDVESQTLTLDGTPVPLDSTLETHLLYKPVGVVSTAKDPQGRTTVIDLVQSSRRLYPVGRLDADSEGLILVSNDGELTHRVTHPRFGITKTYLVVVRPPPKRATLRRLVAGVELDDGTARAVSAHMVDRAKDDALVDMVMVEGRNREIRRMLAALGHEVRRLVRTAIGPIKDPKLKPGQSRLLSVSEVRQLLEGGKEI